MARKKGQMEIMGLTVVIILMILGMLFVVRFVILKPKSDVKQSYADTVLAANLKNSLLLMSTDCHNKRVQDLLADCVSGFTITCPNGQRSCGYAMDRIREVFDKTLDRWNREYTFEACLFSGVGCKTSIGGQAAPIIFLTPPDKDNPGSFLAEDKVCQQERESKFSPVQTEKGIMKVTLNICNSVIV
tara:strand:- start:5275 stop:5835 length:561 start_codon:yes stop_codon:yes gene_type:complete